jgi:hypothetical protein
MTLRGSAFLALWNDFDPARDAEYSCWHTFEHVPERVGIEGILAGRRYVALERDDHRYFTLYDLASLAALDGPQYADVVDRPTAWSASMRPSFRNFLRQPCERVCSAGIGMAGSIATFRFSVRRPVGNDAWRDFLERQLAQAGVTALYLGAVDVDAKFPVSNTPSGDLAPRAAYVLLVEATDGRALTAQCRAIAGAVGANADLTKEPEWESYELAFAVAEGDLREPKGRRQPARADLQRRWQPKP